jgi:ribosome maturation factor RimP
MKDLKKYIEGKLAEYLLNTPYYLVELNILPSKKLEVFIDGDQNVRLDQCIKINQYLIEMIDLNSELERDFQIEVSSPGVSRPFNSLKQYQKNLNKMLEITLCDNSVLEGRLNEVKEGEIEILEQIKTKNKNIHKAKTKPHLISFNEIKQSKVLVTF